MQFPNMLAKLDIQTRCGVLASSNIKSGAGALIFSVSVGYFD